MSIHLFTRPCFHEVNSIILIIKNDSSGPPMKGMNNNPPPAPRTSTILAVAALYETGLSLILHFPTKQLRYLPEKIRVFPPQSSKVKHWK